MNDTDLTLEIIGKGDSITPFSARECTQTLSPIPQGILRRTINGVLVCVAHKGHRKFQSTLTCRDKAAPAFEGAWKGTLLKVGCIQSITQIVPRSTERVQLEREGISIHLYESSGKTWPVQEVADCWVPLPRDFPGGFLTYRPVLLMMVKEYSLETDEWGLSVGWKLELEEV
ncbi:MAG: hypothetical protein H0X26_01980 [Alphaproteobacteria bacterium]|nr:hypothetical protein [Alphaproteobacteria bacterium]